MFLRQKVSTPKNFLLLLFLKNGQILYSYENKAYLKPWRILKFLNEYDIYYIEWGQKCIFDEWPSHEWNKLFLASWDEINGIFMTFFFLFIIYSFKGDRFFSTIMTSYMIAHSCIDIYSYSCLHPLSNERKSMFKSGDSRAVWKLVWTWKYLKWALHYLHDVIYGTHCGPDWSFRRCFCSRKRCVLLWRNDVQKYTADTILFREIQCKKMDNLMF